MNLLRPLLYLLMPALAAGSWSPQTSGTTSRFRAVRIVNHSVAWASGANGTYARTTDGGEHWKASVVPDAERLDFRDIHAVDDNTAYLLSIGEGDNSRIYKTTDGGRSWTLQFKNTKPKAFFDGIAFWSRDHGIAFSDPVDGRFVIIRTTDGGARWVEVSPANIPLAIAGEAAFSASGTSIVTQGTRNAWIGTGGSAARVFRTQDAGATWKVAPAPIISGAAAAGIFSLAFRDVSNGVAVGGDYGKERESTANFAVTSGGGQTWTPDPQLPGYRSAVAFVRSPSGWDLIACGPSGSDYWSGQSRAWTALDTTGYHALSFLQVIPVGFAVGDAGRIAKWSPGSMMIRGAGASSAHSH